MISSFRRQTVIPLVFPCCQTPKTWVLPLELRCYLVYKLRYKYSKFRGHHLRIFTSGFFPFGRTTLPLCLLDDRFILWNGRQRNWGVAVGILFLSHLEVEICLGVCLPPISNVRLKNRISNTKVKVLHGTAPKYLGPVIRVADLPGRQALRSASTNRLVEPPFKLSTIGSRVFSVAGPQIWNSLPEDITSALWLLTFRKRMKTHLFRQPFPLLVH